mmetsp:Transcript_150479/g.382551  ORF Transcript_150479/g.382551 Transcript_150479/m.382551 type:complete len:170 (+) Transcript_150479:516-1025(+)
MGLDPALVRALRRLAADFLQANAHDEEVTGNGMSFAQIVEVATEYPNLDAFCHRAVLVEGVEAEHVVLNALAAALGIGLRVALLDPRDGSAEVPFQDYGGELEQAEAEARPVVHVQLRPGHYDLLYFGPPPVGVPRSSGTVQCAQTVPGAGAPGEVVLGRSGHHETATI